MIVENAEPTEISITFTAPSIGSDNTIMLSSYEENYTHGTLCGFSLVGI
jgi:hypothetical protein